MSSMIREFVLARVIAQGPIRYATLCDLALRENLVGRGIDGQRAVDRALQALRKRGLVAFDSKSGWSTSSR